MDIQRKYQVFILSALVLFFGILWSPINSESGRDVKSLLPELETWTVVESPQIYRPDNLFEYINGAAESYISYEFKELVVAEYKKDDHCEVVLEIYDMGDKNNSFGIYSSERYPDSHFISLGTQGYLEQGTLNFLVDKYYVKLMSFECGDKSEEYLKKFAEKISEKVPGPHTFPSEFRVFPTQGLTVNSERFILINFLGYDFLHSGYTAEYQIEGKEFSCFLIKGSSEQEAQQMMEKYIEAKKDQEINETSYGFHIKDRYYENIFIAQQGRYLCGVMEAKDSFKETGKEYLEKMIENLKEINLSSPL
ncbi:MAG: DUF6599 family protein [Acidobacteriota bacterium]